MIFAHDLEFPLDKICLTFKWNEEKVVKDFFHCDAVVKSTKSGFKYLDVLFKGMKIRCMFYGDCPGVDTDEFLYRNTDLDRSLFCAILRQLDFERVQFLKNMEEYSEGQKKKVLLAASLLTPAYLYIWDEPLNYIDVFSRMQIRKLLMEYQPTMLFVEYDVRFREKIATKTIELGEFKLLERRQ